MLRIFSLLQAILFIISSFAVPDSNFKFLVDRTALDMTATTDIEFESITANEIKTTQAEKETCRKWYEANVLNTEKPAYNFRLGGKSLRNNIDDWDISVGEESAEGAVYRGGKTTHITLTHKKSGIVAKVEATIYEKSATCEWTVFILNTAEEKSAVVSDFYAADCVLPIKSADVYFSKGSKPAADDFQLMKSSLGLLPLTVTANGGRTETALPYFNISGKDNGAVFCVGWSGQWFASLSQTLSGVKIQAKQEKLKGYLEAGEEIRSPLVTLTFYSGNNPIKGFNSYRNWTRDYVYPEGTKQITTSGVGVEFPESTIDSLVANINSIPDWFAEAVDYYWVDAGWYPINTNWGDSVGSWRVDPTKFDRSFLEVSQAANEKGIGWLLWYEPERCAVGTDVYNECIKHDGWLIEKNEERNMVNFANEECLEYITGVMLNSLRDNGVNYLRIDSIPAPYEFWQKADENWSSGRKGITENHYVTNLYRFLDTLKAEIDGLMIDNCCSGGKRIDAEMSRRSIPLWRSDYNCMDGEGKSKPDILEATQSQTYGLSFWLPYSGTCAYIDGEYADRTNIISCSQRLGYQDVRKYMVGNYYPLDNGGLDTDKYLAMQFDNNAESGTALIYKRENVKENTFTLRLSGLDPEKTYEYYDYDKPDTKHELSGLKLMTDGVQIKIDETPKAIIILYTAK